MIILDQERKGLINSDMVLGFSARPNPQNDDNIIVAILTPESNVIIGEYKTEARTEMVFDNLRSAFESGLAVYDMPIE